MDRYKCFFLLALWYLPYLAIAQSVDKTNLSDKEKAIFLEARKAAQKGDLKKSNKKYVELLNKQPNFTEGVLRLASNYYSENDFEKAIMYFEKAIQIDPDFDPEMYYSLANVYGSVKNYQASASNYDTYISKSPADTAKSNKAKAIRDNMLFIDNALKNPVPFNPQNLGPSVNSKFSEYSPSIAIDGKSIIFTRNNGQEDFYISKIDSTGYSVAQELFGMNTSQNEGAFALSANGRFMVFTACDRRDAFGGCDLYSSTFSNNRWSIPVNMGHIVNSAAWDSQPTLTADGRTLYFSSNRLGSIGQSDIWMTYRDEKNAWVVPVNMGPSINTSGKEETPYLHADGQTLYFRSDGRPGMGGYDIYYSRSDEFTGNWSEPINIGYPINTEGQEGSFVVSLDGTKAYFTSDTNFENGSNMGNLDLFSTDLYENARPVPTTFVRGYVKDITTNSPVKANIVIKNLKTGKNIYSLTTDEDGYFISSIAAGYQYACIIEQVDYMYYSQNFDLSNVKILYTPYELEILLQPLPTPEEVRTQAQIPVILHNIFFASGSAELLPESSTEISSLASMLASHPEMNINILGHTDNVGTEEDNLKLSQSRAEAVANALINNGVNSARIIPIGLGESQPIDTNDTAEGRQHNRRTEFIISNK